MKKLVSIFLLGCFALYHFGYYGVYYSFNLQIENNWIEKIYSEHDAYLEEKLMEIPLAIPYMADEENFRPTNTTFEIDGQQFRAIKQRYVKDTLQVVYVADTAKKNLENTIQQWITSLISDELPDAGNSLMVKVFAKEYIQQQYKFQLQSIALNTIQFSGFIFSTYQNQYANLNTPPPEVFS